MKHHAVHVNRTWIPNSVTALSVFMGYLSIVYTFQGAFVMAAWFILLAGILDLMDGRLARAFGGGTKFGSYFDSLADAINYGVAPSLLFYRVYFVDWAFWGNIFSFLPTMCGAVRLARFNVLSENSGKADFFLGLPTTAAAGLLASFVIFMYGLFANYGSPTLAAGLVLATSLLMVSEVPYEHNKVFTHKSWKAFLFMIALATLAFFQGSALFLWGAVYVGFGLLRSALYTLNDLF
jgi:CDP-diacylglycerol---serine O-phosphatidyltransferase